MNWYYIDGPHRVGPLSETDWEALVRAGKIQPETLVWHEGMEGKWLPWSQFAPPPEPGEEAHEEGGWEDPETFADRVADRDYPVEIGRCLSRAWAVFKSRFWALAGAVAVLAAVVASAARLPVLDVLLPMALQGVLMGGFYLYYLRLMRGEPATLADLFAGFSPVYFKPLALQTLVSTLVAQVCFLPAGIAAAMMGLTFDGHDVAGFAAKLGGDPQAALVLLLVFLACSIPAVYFTFCWMFAIPLIVDREMPFWPAMQLSRRKVLQHPWRIGVLSVVAGALGLAGLLGMGIGVLFTLPFYFLIVLFLYEDIFNAPKEP